MDDGSGEVQPTREERKKIKKAQKMERKKARRAQMAAKSKQSKSTNKGARDPEKVANPMLQGIESGGRTQNPLAMADDSDDEDIDDKDPGEKMYIDAVESSTSEAATVAATKTTNTKHPMLINTVDVEEAED